MMIFWYRVQSGKSIPLVLVTGNKKILMKIVKTYQVCHVPI